LWEETRAFQLPGDRYSYLRINLLGREQHGIVTPGVEYDGLLLGIAAELNDLRVEPGGERAIKNISFPRRDMPGPYHDSLPDIAIEWNQDLTIHGLHSTSVCLSTDTNIDHSNEFNTSGFILVSGKNMQPIPQIADIDFRSVASTVLALFSLDQPQAYQLPSLVKYEHAVSKPLQQVAS
jgi:predicted AlkP superfamily phosphohydrolase/phosphomutase